MNRQVWEIDYYAEILDLREKVRQLREVLEFYADENNYDGYVDYDYQWTGTPKQYDSEIEDDRGERARRTLEELSDD